MGKPTGFLEFTRVSPQKNDPKERIGNFREFVLPFEKTELNKQAARCMNCGVPFCHHGCPLGNVIPEFNDAVYREDWLEAYDILTSTNNFPEFTGRICPAPCESSCVLGINQPPVSIEEIEKHIIEIAFDKGYVQPKEPLVRTGKKVAVVGSGPAGLAVAAQLNQAGIGYLHVIDGLAFGFHQLGEPVTLQETRQLFPGTLIGNCGYTKDTAEERIAEGNAELIAFGRPYITNPDLPERFMNKWPINPSE
ncbi:MAG: hypothetical protein ACK43J_06090, partial [Chitinophagaceae bacterium]